MQGIPGLRHGRPGRPGSQGRQPLRSARYLRWPGPEKRAPNAPGGKPAQGPAGRDLVVPAGLPVGRSTGKRRVTLATGSAPRPTVPAWRGRRGLRGRERIAVCIRSFDGTAQSRWPCGHGTKSRRGAPWLEHFQPDRNGTPVIARSACDEASPCTGRDCFSSQALLAMTKGGDDRRAGDSAKVKML